MSAPGAASDDLLDLAIIEAYRLKLRACGFAPVPCVGKAPPMAGWQRLGDSTEHEIRRWTWSYSGAINTGVLTRLNPALDLDILDEEAAAAAEALARERFGEDAVFPVRFGRAPKRAILFRCDLPFGKLAADLVGPLGPDKGEKIEILGDGGQVVCNGVHPDTGRPYSWHGGRPGDFSRHDLALIDDRTARALLHDIVELLILGYGYARKRPEPKPGPGGDGQDRAGPGDWAIDYANHDAVAALAMRLLKSGMSAGSAVNFLRGNVEKFANVDEGRRGRRLAEIPGMVSSARAKLDAEGAPPSPPDPPDDKGPARVVAVTIDDLRAYMPTAAFIFMPSGEMWPGKSVNARVPPVNVGTGADGKPIMLAASTWLARERPVEQMTWAPGEPQLIRDKLITGGGWLAHRGAVVFNLYRPSTLKLGDPNKAGKWRDHVKHVYPDDAERIERWLAHRVQRPQVKINHALVLGGPQGVGKDTLLEPVKRAVGPWNFAEVSPQQLLGRFNGFLKSVILRVSEARDLGEVNRYAFYEHLKAYTAAPPDVLRVDEKNLREYYVLNLCGVVITTNNKTNGMFLPEDDRRHFVVWTTLTKEDFALDYWIDLWAWYDQGGDRHVAAYLASLDLSGFDPKAPPPKTPAFWDIVDAGRAPEDSELADVIDALADGRKGTDGALILPRAFAMSAVLEKAIALADKDRDGKPTRESFAGWLIDRRNRRSIPHRFETCAYSSERNPATKAGLWIVNGVRQVVYARTDLPPKDRAAAVKCVVDTGGVALGPLLDLFTPKQ